MKERLSRTEIGKDAIQDGVEAAAATVGQVTSLVTATIGEVSRAIGALATELFEIRDAARHAASVADEAEDPERADSR